jgi:hypothetical protein
MRRNKSGLPEYCGWNYDRHGKRRVRFRQDGFSTYITGTPWSEEFMRHYAAALDRVKAQAGNVGIQRTKLGTVNALAVAWSCSFANVLILSRSAHFFPHAGPVLLIPFIPKSFIHCFRR